MKLSVNTKGGSSYSATIVSELMENHIAAKVVDTTHKIVAIEDSNGQPIVFSIGSDNHLYVIYNKPGSPTGWEQENLTNEFGTDFTATTFAVSQRKSGEFNIAVAMSNSTATGSQVYISKPLTNDPNSINWKKLKANGNWVFRSAIDKNVTLSTMIMGANTANGPLIIGQGLQKDGRGFFRRYYINGNPSDTTWTWKEFPIPENATEILDTALGLYTRGRLTVQVVYELYKVKNDLELVMTGQYQSPHSQTPGTINIFLKAPKDATSLATTLISDTQTDLYVGGSGITYFAADEQSNQSIGTLQINAKDIPSVHDIIISQDDANISLWAISGDENLIYTSKTIEGDWQTPLPIQTSVVQMTALRSSKLNANQIFMLKGDNSLAYMWQDPSTSLWKSNPIPLTDLKEIITFKSFTTHINLKDDQGNPIQEDINITATAWTYVTINGISHSIDKTTPAVVKPDLLGNLTIINKVDSMATPIFSLESAQMTQIIDIDPASHIIEGLSKIKTGNDLKKAKTQKGKSVLGRGAKVDPDNGAKIIQKLVQLHPHATASLRPTATRSAPRLMNLSSKQVSLRPHHHSLNSLDLSHLDSSYNWGMTISNTGAVSMLARATPGRRSASNTFIGTIGDILETIGDVIKDAINIVVNIVGDVANFIITIGKAIYEFVVDTVEQLYKAISWVIKQIGIAFEKLIEWLGFLFSWDDILTTHKVFTNVAKCSLDYGSYILKTDVESAVKKFFEGLKDDVKKLSTYDLAKNKEKIKSSGQSYSGNTQNSHFTNTMNSPGGNWGTYQLMHGGVLNGVTDSNVTHDPFTDFINDVVLPTVKSVEHTAEQLIKDFRLLFENDNLTTAQVIEKMGIDLLVGIIDAIETIVVGLIEFLADLITFFKDVISAELDIPLLSSFYKWITKGSEFSVLDGISLIFSIPATIIFKLAADKAPFADGTHGLDTMGFKEMFQLFGVSTSSPAPKKGGLRKTRALAMKAPKGAKIELTTTPAEPNEAVALYSQIGGYVYGVASLTGGILSILSAYYSSQEGTEGKVSVIGKIKVGVAVVGLAGSFPVGNRNTMVLERVVWGINGASIIKEAIALKVGEGGKVIIGGYEIVEAITKLVLQIVISAKQMSVDKGQELTNDTLKLFEGILNNLSIALGGGAKIDKEPETQAILAASGVAVKIVSTFITVARLGANYAPKVVAKIF